MLCRMRGFVKFLSLFRDRELCSTKKLFLKKGENVEPGKNIQQTEDSMAFRIQCEKVCSCKSIN